MIQFEAQIKPFQSTLWMATQEPQLNNFLCYLTQKKDEFLQFTGEEQILQFSTSQLEAVRKEFSLMILRGEEKLHRLCSLLSGRLLDDDYFLKSVVIGKFRGQEPFTLSQPIDEEEIYSRTDLDLGNRLLDKLKFQSGAVWQKADLVANFVEYQSASLGEFKLHKMISRIKAEEEIWAKTVDEIFNLDQIISRDKELRKLSFYIKDIFGVKLVVSENDDVSKLLEYLKDLELGEQPLQVLEVKNHLGLNHQKKSGWRAVKAVIKWWDKVFEIQVQPLEVYLREQEYLTGESHAGFKARREELRQEVASKIPLFGFYLKLLKWLFMFPEESPPKMERITIEMIP